MRTWKRKRFENLGKAKNNTNNITSLKVGASVTTNQDIIKVFENHFTQLYKSKKKASFDIFLDHLNERKNEGAHDVNEITIDEVLKAISELNVESSPGSDGITSNFYKIFKRELAPLLQRLFNNIVRTEKVLENQQIAILKFCLKQIIREPLMNLDQLACSTLTSKFYHTFYLLGS